MATHKREFSGATHKQYLLDDNYESQEEEMYQLDSEDDYEEEEEEEEKRGGRWSSGRRKGWSLGQVLDPRAKWVREWNRVNLLFILTGLFLDPLFFYALSTSDSYMCLFIDGWFAITITVLRCMTDAFHVWNMWLQLKMDTRLYSYTVAMAAAKDEDEGGGGDGASHTATAGRRVAVRYLKDWKGFFFDLFVILPIPQMVLWVIIPSMLKEGSVTVVMTIFLITFLFQYLPKVYHSARRLRHLQNLSGHVFGTISGGIFLNFIAYFVVAHAAGACWYMLGTQRSTKCLSEQCRQIEGCDLRTLACKEPIYYGTTNAMRERPRLAWAGNQKVRSTCIDSPDIYQFGGYKWAAQLVTNESRLEKILYPIFWGIMTLSTFGNLESSTNWLEVVFKIIVLIIALVLFTMLIGNIKVFLQATTTRKQAMQLKMRNIEWWMRKRHLPQGFRQRVRNFERQKWEAMRGVDEHQMIRNLPEGLRRSIKYHLCLDLVRQVPLFQHMDDLVLENICDRVKSLIFTKGETITRQGDPVQRMLFVVRGHLQSSQVLQDGVKSCCMLGPGNFSGDELLSWCLRRPFIKRLPPSSSTLVTLETTEAFGLEAEDVKYVAQHFRYTFVNEKVKRSARYYSPGWRTWAAVAIQLAWRRYKHRLRLTSLSFIRPRSPLSRSNSLGDQDMLRLYAAMLAAKKPNQDDFDF